MRARILPDGTYEVRNIDGLVTRWSEPTAWADDWLREWRSDSTGPASEFLFDATRDAMRGVVEVLVALATAAAWLPEQLGWVGAGPLEDLVSHEGHAATVMSEVESAAQASTPFRSALAHVVLGPDIDSESRARLVALGARNLVTEG